MKVRFAKLHPMAQIPKYANDTDAGMDIIAISKTETEDYIEYGTGFAIEIPEGHAGFLFPRSSISNHDLQLCNSIGLIDSGYRGEVKFRFNHVSTFRRLFSMIKEFIRTGEISPREYHISDKIGQLVIMPVPKIEPEEADTLSESDRGTGGFGSTGK